jgi:UDP-2-acetamido-3-amino-2,3-dideoxy-glucuronate N-acetyltransferase
MVFIHKLADVSTETIGEGTKIWQFAVVLSGAKIGANCNISALVLIENDVVIGDNVTVKSGVQLWDGVRVADNVFIGPNVTFTNDLIPRSKIFPETFAQTTVCIGASIGANSTIVAGNTIGDYALIGAGSVITHNVPPFTVWYGVPAKHQGYVTAEGELIGLDLLSKTTGQHYLYQNNQLTPIP